jgi:hypothetical protein
MDVRVLIFINTRTHLKSMTIFKKLNQFNLEIYKINYQEHI